MAMSTARERGCIAEINVTPMADVVIVLLIIMMVAVPLLGEGRVQDLPQAARAAKVSGALVLSVAADASLDVDGRVIALDELLPRLQAALDDSRVGRTIQLKVDRDLPYAALASVLAVCRRAGAEEIAFVTRPKLEH
jgi:biopolymer transport protein ExbD